MKETVGSGSQLTSDARRIEPNKMWPKFLTEKIPREQQRSRFVVDSGVLPGHHLEPVVAVIPAHNEECFIGSVVLKTKQFVDEVIVVDDGSSDATAEVAHRAGAYVVSHSSNRGKVTAVETGVLFALSFNAITVVMLNGDGRQNPEEIPGVIQPLLSNEADIVIATYFQGPKRALPTSQRAAQTAHTAATSVVSELPFDLPSGFRAFSPHALQILNGFSLKPEFGEIAREHGLKITAFPLISARKPATERQALTPASVQLKASIIIPAYNEEEALPHVLSAIMEIVDDNYEVIVVDDGSTDATRVVASSFSCCVVSHTANRGKGAAMQTGIDCARGEKVIFIDGDATYPVAAIPEIVEYLDHYDVVRGTRCKGRNHIPRLNRLGNTLFDWIIRFAHHVDSTDALTGLYGLRSEALKRMHLQSEGFDIESEIVIKAGAMGLATKSIPIPYNQRIGDKKLRPVRDGMRVLTRILSLAVMFNPFAMYVLPGFALWFIAALTLAAFTGQFELLPFGGSTNSLSVSTMTFLAGFQLVVFGLVANLYAGETGVRVPSRSLYRLAKSFPRFTGAALSVVMILSGAAQTLFLLLGWGKGYYGPFQDAEAIILSTGLVIWGIQLLCTMFFLSMFAGLSRLRP